MPVQFLTNEQAAAYGRFTGVPSQAVLERSCFLDDADLALVAQRRGDHSKLAWLLSGGDVTSRWDPASYWWPRRPR